MPTRIVPQPLESDTEFQRYYHRDLPALDDLRLWQEQRRCEWALSWVEPDTEAAAWLLGRLAAIRAEQRRRHRARAG